MSKKLWHYYAEVYYNNNREDGIYVSGSGIVGTDLETDNPEWYNQLRLEICKDIGGTTKNLHGVVVMSLTKL